MRSDMENWKEIRQQVLVHGLSQRGACEKYQLGWQTLKKILSHSEPPERLYDMLGFTERWLQNSHS